LNVAWFHCPFHRDGRHLFRCRTVAGKISYGSLPLLLIADQLLAPSFIAGCSIGEIQQAYDHRGRYEELADPKYTDYGANF
jgi:hypothetical protein